MPGAEHVQVAAALLDTKCRALGDVIGEASDTDQAAAVSEARLDIRNKAAAIGATHVLLETNNTQPVMSFMVPRYKTILSGSAYDCKGAGSSRSESKADEDTSTEAKPEADTD